MSKTWQFLILVVVVVLGWFLLKGKLVKYSVVVDDSSSSMNEQNITKESSAGDVMNSIYGDADLEASVVGSEAEEDAYVNGQVDTFTNIRDTQYENNI